MTVCPYVRYSNKCLAAEVAIFYCNKIPLTSVCCAVSTYIVVIISLRGLVSKVGWGGFVTGEILEEGFVEIAPH